MSPKQRRAYDELRWGSPDPAERAQLKKTLGWRRTTEETVALAGELLDQGLTPWAVRLELCVTDRHWRRIATQVSDAKKRPRYPADRAKKADTTGHPKGIGHPGPADITGRPPPGGFEDASELARWLNANGYGTSTTGAGT
jgi:hypothetical protein